MCGFLLYLSNQGIDENKIKKANYSINSRGPDGTLFKKIRLGTKYIYTVHNLLDISGTTIKQPRELISGTYLLFNGEIYSQTSKEPDTLALSRLQNGLKLKNFLKNANGEFAICQYVTKSNIVTLATDLIGTKPLFYGYDGSNFGVSSYKKPLEDLGLVNIFEAEPNSIISIKLKGSEKPNIIKKRLYDLKLNQWKSNPTDWEKAFLISVKYRATHFKSKVFVPLSAGHDSGAICCALNKMKIPYVTVTLGDTEDRKILKSRIAINKKFSCYKHIKLPPLTKEQFDCVSQTIKEKLGILKYSHVDFKDGKPISLHEDGGAVGLFEICKRMSSLGYNSLLSGSGADEIYSDYGFRGKKIYFHSQFGGLFPEDLEGFFPWKKFFGDSQRSYLLKDEMISGMFGIEGRYPFLDHILCQEFISLSSKVKNQQYKNVISSFLENENYPFQDGAKSGFYPIRTAPPLLKRIINKIQRTVGFSS